MLFSIATRGIEMNNRLRKRVEYRLRFAVGRFEQHVREFAVHVADENGPRGNADTVCRLTATFHRGGTIRVEEKDANIMRAIYRAARRFRNVLLRRMGQKRTKAIQRTKTIRDIALPAMATEMWIG